MTQEQQPDLSRNSGEAVEVDSITLDESNFGLDSINAVNAHTEPTIPAHLDNAHILPNGKIAYTQKGGSHRVFRTTY